MPKKIMLLALCAIMACAMFTGCWWDSSSSSSSSMMPGSSSMMPGNGFSPAFGIMGVGAFFMWLIPLGLLVLSGLGIAALVKYLQSRHN